METLLQVTASWILPALFFWVLLSLITMLIVELIQSLSGSRQKGLEEVLKTMMGEELANKFYSHALVVPLGKYKPAYISPSLFAKVILDWILPKAQVPIQDITVKEKLVNASEPADYQSKYKVYECTQTEISKLARKNASFGCVIQAIVDQANMKSGKLSEFIDLIQTDLETWFMGAVNQMSPVYGGRLRWVTFIVSLIVAMAANFDVVSITSRLWITSKYMEVLNIVEKTGQKYDLPNLDLITMLPVGWYRNYLPANQSSLLLKAIGIYLGAALITVGSQYVFNLTRRAYKPSK